MTKFAYMSRPARRAAEQIPADAITGTVEHWGSVISDEGGCLLFGNEASSYRVYSDGRVLVERFAPEPEPEPQAEITLSDVNHCAHCGATIYEHDLGGHRMWTNTATFEVEGGRHRCAAMAA